MPYKEADMVRKPGFHAGLLILMMLVISACSGGSDPISGSLTGGDEGLTSPRAANLESTTMLWGYWNIGIDTETDMVEILPMRGAMMHVNAVLWMQPPAGSVANLGIAIIDDSEYISTGELSIDVSLSHPFPGLDQYSGFDIMGVFMTDGHESLQSQSGVTISDGGIQDAALLNADGYTRWWNQDEFAVAGMKIFSYIPGKLGIEAATLDARINPYKYFTDGLGATDDCNLFIAENSVDRGKFPAGFQGTRRYDLKFPMQGLPKLMFDYAVVASWEPPIDEPPSVPDDFPLSANALEPIALSIADNSDLYYDEVNDIHGGTVSLELELYAWQGLDPDVTIPDIIDAVAIEFLDSGVFPGGDYFTWNSGTWSVGAGAEHSSVWSCDISTGLNPYAMGDAPALILFETIYDYDNGYGSDYPAGAVLTSYFPYELTVYGTPGVPTCEDPVPEFTDRRYTDIEEYTSVIDAPGGTIVNIDWSVDPYGDPKNWVNTDTDSISVNWLNATADGTTLESYEVCVSAYSTEGWVSCCTSVWVDDLPTLMGTNRSLIQQPDQGAQPCDITVWASSANTTPQIMYQDTALGETRLYRFNNDYSSITGVSTLNADPPPGGAPPPLDDATTWNDYHKFDVTPSGSIIQVTSANNTWPSIADPNVYNVNDPLHTWLLPYGNMTGNSLMKGLFGDIGYDVSGPPMPPDPDNVSWKHNVDWTNGAEFFDGRLYGLLTISEEWLPNHPGYTHPGSIWTIYSEPLYSDIGDDYFAFGLDLSTQAPGGGDVDDTAPDLMALAVDDSMDVEADWTSGPDDLLSDIVVWYILSSESTASNRKVHICLLPEDFEIDWDIFYYDDYIGAGSPWGVDFGGNTPVDLEMLNANDADSMLSHTYSWLAVLLDTGTSWAVNVYRYDPLFGDIMLIDGYNAADDTISGTPTALDVDTNNFEIHVLYDDAGTYKVTELIFTS